MRLILADAAISGLLAVPWLGPMVWFSQLPVDDGRRICRETRVVFVPDSKTEEGRRRVPMSNRVFDVLKQRAEEGAKDGFSHRTVPTLLTSPQGRRDFAKPGSKLGFPKILSSIVGGMITAPGFLREQETWLQS